MTEYSPASPAAAPAAYCPACGTAAGANHAFCVSCGRPRVIDVTDGAVIPAQAGPLEQPSTAEAVPPTDGALIPQQASWPAAEPVWPGYEGSWPGGAQQAWSPAQNPGWPVQVPLQQSSYAEPTLQGRMPAVVPPARAPAQTALLPHGWVPASFGQRVGARVLDGVAIVVLSVLLYVGVGLLTSALGVDSVGAGFLVGALLLIFFMPSIISAIYRICSDYGFGRSLGRAAVGIRLVKLPLVGPDVEMSPEDEVAHVGFGTVLGRLIVSGFGDSIFFLNSLSVLWDPQRRSWGDKASNTAVVVDPNGERRSAWTAPAVAAATCGVMGLGLVLLAQTGPSQNDLASTFGTTTSSTFDTPTNQPDQTVTTPPSSNSSTLGTDGTSTANPDPSTTSTSRGSGSSGFTGSAKSAIVVRSGPGRSFGQIDTIAGGDPVSIVCQTHGEYIIGPRGASDWWDQTASGGYVSDEYVYTGTTGTNATVARSC